MLGNPPLPELQTTEPPHRDLLIRSVAARLHLVVKGFRPIAQDLLADTSRIDVFGVAGDGAAVFALLGQEDEALTLLGRALAQRAWLAPRLADWLKLAPDLGVRPDGAVQALLLCPRFGPEALAAAGAVDPSTLQLVTWRFVRNGSHADVLLEPVAAMSRSQSPEAPARTEAAAPSAFRTGLSQADLGLSDDELAEFE